MALVTEDMLVMLRQYAYSGLVTDVQIKKRVRGDNEYGDSEETWPTVNSTVKGWLRQMNDPAILESLGLAGAVGVFRLEMPVGSDVASGDQVVIGPGIYTVENTNTEDTLQVFLEAYVRKIE